jgi:peptide/nickel transport system substrate-binding protein
MAKMEPMGSGPYKWVGFADNIATVTANADFFLGVPKTGTVKWQYIPSTDVIANLASGVIDIANPTGNISNVEEMKSLGVEYDLIDNAGYGYMGMNTQNVTLNVRKGIWSLMNRKPSVEAYYGEIAQVIERPMTSVLAEYPQDAKEFYPYSKDNALQYFIEAGYSQVGGKLVDAAGKQLAVNCYVGGGGEGDHPAYAMLVQAANDMASLGGELQIQDVQFAILEGAMNDGTADMFILAWSEVNTCDKSAQFRSTGGQNRYRFVDQKMDDLLDKITQTLDLDERRKLVSEMLDWAMENCVEYPLYQRKNILAYNAQNINMDTIPTPTAFYSYEEALWQVELK